MTAIVLLYLLGAVLLVRCWYLWYRYMLGRPSLKMNIPHLMATMSLTVLTMMDAILTTYALSRGAIELNPILARLSPDSMIALKIISMIPFYCFSLVEMRTDLSIATMSTMIVVNIMYFVVVVRGILLLLQ